MWIWMPLRIHRTAGPSRIPRQAHRRRQAGNARRGGGGQLRGAPFRSVFRHAFHEGSQALPPSDFHPQPHGCVQGRLRADTRHFPPLHRSGGTLSLDEAFLDVTENKPGIPLAVDIARRIKKEIRRELHLTASAGVSYNKFLAKIASDYRKPDGLFTIHPSGGKIHRGTSH